jgi:multiple sugar transport system permease protein
MSSADLSVPTPARRTKAVKGARRALGYLALSGIAVVSLLPFAWMISTSLKQRFEVFIYPPVWIPERLQWDNYLSLWRDFPLWNTWIFNSFKITIAVVLIQLLICSMSAYAFARLDFPGRDVIFYLYLGSMMVPDVVNIIPTFVLMRSLGLLDTHAAIIIPSMASAIGIFMLRQFFLSIPRELEDAARVDGAGYWRIYWDIVLPLSKPALATLAVFLFIWTWSDFFTPLIFLNSPEKLTLPVGLAFINDARSSDWERLMAGNALSLVPLLFVYVAAQRYIVQGVTLTGLKG